MEKLKLHLIEESVTLVEIKIDSKGLIEKLETENKTAIDWFKINEMMVSPDKFQTIIVNRNNKMSNEYFLNIGES